MDKIEINAEVAGAGGGGSGPIPTIVPGKSDKEIAEDFRRRMIEVHGPVLKLHDEMNAAGFMALQSIGLGGLGTHVITQLQIVKRLA